MTGVDVSQCRFQNLRCGDLSMKVVLFCGGYGMRMREGRDDVPKPMVRVGERPLLWHVMRYYAHFGHKEFILCLGFGAHHIKEFFLHYRETTSNNFVLRRGGGVELLSHDIYDWTITFVDTGLETPIGERLRRVKPYLAGEEMFLANYADTLTDAPMNEIIANMAANPQYAASLLAVPPQMAFHMVERDAEDRVTGILPVTELDVAQNGGYFVFRKEVLDELQEGEDLVTDTLQRMSSSGKVYAHMHRGFWMPADTVKERAELEKMYQSGNRPWALWKNGEML